MIQEQAISTQPGRSADKRAALGLWAIFITQFVSLLLINARNIAHPVMIAEFDGMALFPWLIALPALSGAVGTLLAGKLSDMYGRRVILLASIIIFAAGLLLMSFSRSAVGAIFFFQIIGIAVAPAILGLAQNSASDLESGLKRVFLVSAVTMLISLLMIFTIPEVSMDVEVPDKADR